MNFPSKREHWELLWCHDVVAGCDLHVAYALKQFDQDQYGREVICFDLDI